MSEREDLLKSLSETIADYRGGDIPKPSPDHVAMWVEQFDAPVQLSILREMDHVLKQTYLPKRSVQKFLSAVAVNEKLTGGDPHVYWRSVELLDIQGAGDSQSDMLEMFGDALGSKCGLSLAECSGSSGIFVYLDDGVYTGNRVLGDLRSWIQSNAPDEATVNVISIALHLGGQHYAKTELHKASKVAGKAITSNWWRCVELEDRKTHTDRSDVLRPTEIPDDSLVREYVDGMAYKPILRKPSNLGKNEFFSSEEGRHVLEQEFLKAGVRIRSMCPYLNDYQRPLGNSVLETLGFGSLLVTFRNCPNNAPLALWAGDPWYPLFPRKTN